MEPIFAHGFGDLFAYLMMFLLYVAGAVVAAVMTLVVGTLVLLLGTLLGGGVLTALVKKTRHLFWILPLLNVGLYFLCYPLITMVAGVYLGANLDLDLSHPLKPAGLYVTLLSVPLFAFGGCVSAMALSPIHAVLVRRRARESGRPSESPPNGQRGSILPTTESPPHLSGNQFVAGLTAPLYGLHYMMRHPALWRYGLLPLLLNLLITAVLFVGLIVAAVFCFNWLPESFPEGWLWTFAAILVALTLLVVAAGLTFVAWMVLQGILCGHFYGKLAERVERQLGTPDDQIKDVPLLQQVHDTFRNLGFLAAVNVACLCVQIVPGIGSLLGICGSWYFNCFTLGLEYLDYPMALRGMRRKEQRAVAKRHRPATLGLGSTVLATALIPVVGAVLLTTAVVGAVLLYHQLHSFPKSAKLPMETGRGLASIPPA